MKKFIKSILSKKVSRFFSFYMNKEYMPFTYKSLADPESNYSDFFIYNTKFFKNVFIAENTFSLLNLNKIDVIHKLDFYSKEGNFLKTKLYKSKDFISKIELPKFNSNSEYISFIHEDRLRINDLYLERAKLYKKFGDNEQYCLELNEIQNILNSEGDKYKKLISELILESCSQ